MSEVIKNEHFKTAIRELTLDHGFKTYTLRIKSGSQAGENYLGIIYKVSVHEYDKYLHLIVKVSPPFSMTKIHTNSLYKMEIFAYSKLLPAILKIHEDCGEHFRYAKFHKGYDRDDANEMLILEDLSIEGFKTYDRHVPLDYEHLSMSIKKLAKYHAGVLVLKHKNPELYRTSQILASNVRELDNPLEIALSKSVPVVLELCKNEPYFKDVEKYCETIFADFMECMNEKKSAPYNVICHGDCWSNNFMYRYEGNKLAEMVMIDWQVMMEASPIVDLSTMIFMTTDKRIRADHYDDLLMLYYETLSTCVKKLGMDVSQCFPEEVYREHVRTRMRIGMVNAIAGLPFTLIEKGKALDMEDLFKSEEEGGMKVVPMTDVAKTRLKDIVDDCVKYGYLKS